MAPHKVILLSCGSYNPPTNMHLRMFEIARDHLHKMGSHVVVGGVISPVHDAYGKNDLASSTHRCTMLRLALQNNDWIRLSDWETKKEGWTKTRITLQHHQNLLNSWVFDTNDVKHHSEIEDMDWIPEKIKNSSTSDRHPIQVKLLCGADLLESFGTPGLWAEEDINAIVGQHGLVVVTREGSNPNQFIYDSDLLSKYMHNILIVTEWITNEISSTKIRRALKRGESVKYLLQDSVLDYIYKHEIFDARRTTSIKLELSPNSGNNYLNIQTKYENTFLTPSPSDITMETPSPVEIISIDVPDSILKKNLLNSTGFGSSYANISLAKVDDNDLVREKLIGVISENGNKLLHGMKSAYPGQAKQIIATETGESHILEEVGCISDRSNILMINAESNSSLKPVDTDHYCLSDPQDLSLVEGGNNFPEVIHKTNPSIIYVTDYSEKCSNARVTTDFSQSPENNATLNDSVEATEGPSGPKEIPEVAVTTDEVHEPTIFQTMDDRTVTDDYEERIRNAIVNKDGLEIDGKYLKSLVNSRKSPKKCKDKVAKVVCNVEPITNVTDLTDGERILSPQTDNTNSQKFNLESADPTETVGKMKEDEYTQCDKIDSVNSESQTDLNLLGTRNPAPMGARRKSLKIFEQSQPLVVQGSLDSVKFDVPIHKSVALDSISKKSKSYESIKFMGSLKSISYKSFDVSYSDTLKPKSDSTSQLTTLNFCTECCYTDDTFVSEVGANQESFCTVQSNRSSPVEEDSTECDICSACNLESTEVLGAKSVGPTEKCDLCEMCNDISADFEGDLVIPYVEVDPAVAETRYVPPTNNHHVEIDNVSQIVIDNDQFEIENCGLEKEGNVKNYRGSEDRFDESVVGDEVEIVTDQLVDRETEKRTDNDQFEIENCGSDINVSNVLQKGASALSLHLSETDLCDTDTDINTARANVIYASSESVKYARFSLPKYAPTGISKSGRKIGRKGSFIINDSSKLFQDKRRYSSVDNLQHSKQILKTSERSFQKFKGNKLIASADNIQSNTDKSSKLKKLQKSANDIDSLAENLDTSTENFTFSENDIISDNAASNIRAKIKIRDSDMVKMILTKHGIKIISEKETAL